MQSMHFWISEFTFNITKSSKITFLFEPCYLDRKRYFSVLLDKRLGKIERNRGNS